MPGRAYVFLSSVGADTGEAAQFALNAAKAALQVSARTLAKEICRQGSRINTISPGLILTGLTEHDLDKGKASAWSGACGGCQWVDTLSIKQSCKMDHGAGFCGGWRLSHKRLERIRRWIRFLLIKMEEAITQRMYVWRLGRLEQVIVRHCLFIQS